MRATDVSTSSNRRALVTALVLYLVWVGFTYGLEGRLHTLLRPEATGDRLVYALVANVLVGLFGAGWVLHRFVQAKLVTMHDLGFRSARRIAVSVPVAALLGLGFYAVQGAPTWHPIVLINAFAQVLVVTIAEVLVCWVVAGSLVEKILRRRGRVLSTGGAILAAAVLFGLYHAAHSPPFNTAGMMLLLTGVGLVTGLYYFASREVYGTLVFHNMAGVFGVTQALSRQDALATLAAPQLPLWITAIVSLALLIAVHYRLR